MLAEKTQQGENPILYSFYGKQYDYNALAQAADAGFNDHILTLKRGEKDYNEFRDAYLKIMSGIRDGSITFENGQFHDSKGRYTNASKKDKDYYGLMANYIYGKMGQSGLYEKPVEKPAEEPKPWDASANIRKALIQEIYNSDSPNLQDFLDLDAQTDGIRAITNRTARLSGALQSLADSWDTRFTGYSNSDKAKYTKLLTEAADALKDGTIDPGDYLTLSRAVGGIDFRKMMDVGTSIQKTTQDNTQQTVTQQQSTPQSTTQQAPTTEQTTTQKEELLSMSLPDSSQSDLASRLNGFTTQNLIKLLNSNIRMKDYMFGADERLKGLGIDPKVSNELSIAVILQMLLERGDLKLVDPDNPNQYFIPGTKDKKSGNVLVWDKSKNTLSEMKASDIPYITYTPAKKEGGILYAQDGNTFNNIYASSGNPDYNNYLSKLINNDRMLSWLGVNYGNLSDYEQFIKDNVNKRYKAGINDYNNQATYSPNEKVREFNTHYQQHGNNYILFGNSADEYDNQKGGIAYDMGLTWSRPANSSGTGDSWNKDKTKAYIDNALGLQTYSRVASLTDKNLTTGKFGKWGDYWKTKGAAGAYYYVADGDNSGRGQWIPTNDITHRGYVSFEPQKLNASTNIPRLSTTSRISALNDELTPVAEEAVKKQNESLINPTTSTKKSSWWSQNKQEISDRLLPLGAEAVRLGLSLRANNKIAKVLTDSIKPVLEDTYELYSPITGAFSEMQLRNRQAADVRREAARPYTSDASLNAARVLEGNRQGNELEYQGFLADDKEIQRTKQEAIKRREDNIARRTKVSNYNRAAMNEATQKKAQIEAQRLQSNYQGIDNFISGNVVAPLKENAAYNLKQKREAEELRRYNNASYDLAPISTQQAYQTKLLDNYYNNKKREIQAKYQDAFNAFEKAHPSSDYTKSPEYLEFIGEIQKLNEQEYRDKYEMSNYFISQTQAAYNHVFNNQNLRTNNPFTFTPSDQVKQQNWYKRINGFQYKKNGGKLSLATQYLLNKVIK